MKDKSKREYFYPNVYYLLGGYIGIFLVMVLIWPVRASSDSVTGAAVVGLSVLAVSLVAGPLTNKRTIENSWLHDAAASSFFIMFALLALGGCLAAFNIITWQLLVYGVLAITTLDLVGKMILAKKRAS